MGFDDDFDDGFDSFDDADSFDDGSDGFDDDFAPAPTRRSAPARDSFDGFDDDFDAPPPPKQARPPRREPEQRPPRRGMEDIPTEGPELREYILKQDRKRKRRVVLLSFVALFVVFLSVWCTGYFTSGFMPWDIKNFKVGGAKVSDLFLIADPEELGKNDPVTSGPAEEKEQEEEVKASPEDGFVIEDRGEYCAVIGYSGADKQLVLPQTYKGKPVTEIGTCAFANVSYTDIKIPDGYTVIGQSAFTNCSITDISFPESVTEIGWGACSNCYALESIKLPSTIESISDWAFASCPKLNNVKLPETVTVIGEWAFNNCCSMTDFEFSPNVTEIKSCAFYECKSFEAIELPATVKSIGDMAFRSCAALKIIVIPDSVTVMGAQVFMNCNEGLTLCGTKGGMAETYATNNNLLYVEP